MTQQTAKVVHYTRVPGQVYGEEAPGVTIRWVIDEEHDGAPVYALRVVEVAPGGHTPRHTHPYEHENFIVAGRGRVWLDGRWHDLVPGDVAFVPGGMEHTYENTGDELFVVLCGIPVSRLR